MEKTASNFRLKGGFLNQHGEVLIENGYNIIPIPPGSKGPGDEDWAKSVATKKQLSKWLDEEKGHYGIGIISKNTPAVDIDVPEEAFALELQAKAFELWGSAPVRVGNAPKRLLLYRTNEPFRKITSRTYLNEWEERCRVEILCDGQQFVAFHTHKDTGRPYKWVSDTNPINTPIDDLPEFDESTAQELIEMFEAGAMKRGWAEARSSKLRRQARTGEIDRNDPFAADAQPIDINVAELEQRLMTVPGSDDYDVWLQVGMALYHQFAGEEEGKTLWHQWSESADNYDAEALERKWRSFDITDKRRAPITARLIMRLAQDAAETSAAALAVEIRNLFATARDIAEWKEAAAKTRRAELDVLTRATIAEVARERMQGLTNGAKIPLPEVKKMLAYEINNKDQPKWVRGWVYDVSDDRYYHLDVKMAVTVQGFNAMNDRFSLTKKDKLDGKTTPTSNASNLALNVYKVPSVNGRMYAPGRDSIFMYEGVQYANTYPEKSVPLKPKAIRPIDKTNIKRIKQHLKHLFIDEADRHRLMNWIAYVVQNPGKRVNYAPLIQGVQGDGKSFFAFLLAAVMGQPNVRMGNAHILEGSFTGWAEGQCVMAIEEIRLIGHNRYDVLNRVKPFITNKVIEIHPKGRNPYNVENTTNYILFTNYRDAMPLSPNERRFLVLFSQWQKAEELRTFKDENPDYYVDLYAALDDSAPALRQWLLQYEIPSDFNPQGDAPITAAFDYMVDASTPPDVKVLQEAISQSDQYDICDELLNITLLQFTAMELGVELPEKRGLDKALEIEGFWPLGRVRVDGEYVRFYSKNPEKFMSNIGGKRVIDNAKIRKWIDDHKPPGVDDDDEL